MKKDLINELNKILEQHTMDAYKKRLKKCGVVIIPKKDRQNSDMSSSEVN